MKKISLLRKAGSAGMLVAAAVMAGSVSANGQSALQLAQRSGGDFDPARAYSENCSTCHDSGAAGAPRMGNAEEWAPRAEQGFEILHRHAIEGYNNNMPPRGLCFDCTDEQLGEVVRYILDESLEDGSTGS